MALCDFSRRGVVIVLILGLSFVYCSEDECEPFGDDFPSDRFEVTFKNGDLEESIDCGKNVPLQEFTGKPPTVRYSNAESDGKYLIAMVDPDAPSRNNPTCKSWLHWIVGDIEGDDLKEGSISSGCNFEDYNPPSPPKGSGPHRYYLFIFKQEHYLDKDVAAVNKRCGFSIDGYREIFKLRAEAANMFRTENK